MLETLFPGRIDLGIGRAPGSDQLHRAGARGARRAARRNSSRSRSATSSRGSAASRRPSIRSPRCVRCPTGDSVARGLAARLERSVGRARRALRHRVLVRPLHQRRRRRGDHARVRPPVQAVRPAGRADGQRRPSSSCARRRKPRRSGWRRAATCSSHGSTPVAAVATRRWRRRRPIRTRRGSGRSSPRRSSDAWPARREQCRERLEALARDYGVDEIVAVTITETPATRLRSYELLAEAFELTSR